MSAGEFVVIALIVIASVAGILLLSLFFRQPRIVFKPSRELIGDPRGLGLEFEDVQLPLENGIAVHGWWIPAPPHAGESQLPPSPPAGEKVPKADEGRRDARKVILCFPGSIGNISHELTTMAFLRGLGANVFIIDYPGFGKSGGRPTESGCYLAAAAAWEFATQKKGIRGEDVILFGRSLGGTVAAWLAARKPDCGRLVIHSAFTSVPDVAARTYPFFPVRYFCYIRFNTLKQIRGCRCPIVIMHPTADTVIPVLHSERILAEAPEPKRFIPLRGNHYGSEWQNTPGLRGALGNLLMGGRDA